MDNLKKINDVYGHKAGDRALRLVGAMLTECMENAVVCRLGGDEFLFYLPEAVRRRDEHADEKLFDSLVRQKMSRRRLHRHPCPAVCACAGREEALKNII